MMMETDRASAALGVPDLGGLLGLSDARVAVLARLAEARGSDPVTVVRGWVLEQLDVAEAVRDHATERWARDFRSTSEHLRRLLDEHPAL